MHIRPALAALALACLLSPVAAQDRAAWFKSLRQPDTGMSCCDISDCKKTQAKWSKGGWSAIVRGYPRAIPPNIILKNNPSIDGEAYVCASEYGPPDKAQLYCFIPPSPGS